MDLINILQAELTTLRQGLSDLELIITHTGKLSADPCFIALKMQYLQNNPFRNADLPPSFTQTPATLPIVTWTWSAYSADVHHFARAHGASRTHTVLAAHVDMDPLVTDPSVNWAKGNFSPSRGGTPPFRTAATSPHQDRRRQTDRTVRYQNDRKRSDSPHPTRPQRYPAPQQPPPHTNKPNPNPSQQMTNAEYQKYYVARQQMLQRFKTDFIQNIRSTNKQSTPTNSPQHPAPAHKRTYSTMADNDAVDPLFEELTQEDMEIFNATAAVNEDTDDNDFDDDQPSEDYDGVINGASR